MGSPLISRDFAILDTSSPLLIPWGFAIVGMPEDPAEDKKPETGARPLAVALSAGTELAVSVLAGFLAGQWLDRKFGTGPWLTLVGALGGIAFGLYQLVRVSIVRQDRR